MHSLYRSGRILYISSVDISIGNGPGVNEREFTLALHRAMKDRAHFLIPQPERKVFDLPDHVCTFSAPHRGHSPKRYPGHVWSTMRLADQILSEQSFDLLVFRLDLLPFAPLYITRRHRIPFALKTLGQGQMNTIRNKVGWPLGSWLSKVNLHLVKQLVKDAIVVDTVSELQRQALEQMLDAGPDKITCVDNAVNTDRFYPTSAIQARVELGLAHYDQIIGYIGNHATHERGGTQLVDAARMLLPKYPRLGFVILGDVSGSQHLIDMTRELGIEDHFRFTGYVPFDQVPTYVNTLDIGVSLLAPKYQGQSELKVRQYLACGKPVIATTPGSNDFLAVESLGSLARYDDINAITKEMDRWLSLPADERLEVSERAFRYARDHLSVEQSLTRRMELWDDRLADPRSGALMGAAVPG